MGTANMPWWEVLLIGLAIALIIYFFRPGVKAMLEESKRAEKDWPSALIPLGLVVLFVILLIAMV